MGSAPRFVYAELGREGLGNLLFPLGRAIAISEQTDSKMLPPKWLKIRLGPYLRRERDKRGYHKLFARPSVFEQARRAYVLASYSRVEERDRFQAPTRSVAIVRGMEDYFEGLFDFRLPIIRYLADHAGFDIETLRRKIGPYVALHIRMGDFMQNTGLAHGARNTPTPIEWFERAIEAMSVQRPGAPIVVCSDGSDSLLEPLMKLGRVTRSSGKSAIEDLAVLAGADLIIGSGSTFSAWGAFLGQTPMTVDIAMNHYLKGSGLVTEISDWSAL